MKISIITPTYESLATLKQTCKSIEDQRNADFEHIIIDGNSKDGTTDWLSSNGNVIQTQITKPSSSFLYPSLDESIYETPNNPEAKFQYISEADNGIYDALNKGFKHANGEILAWLNSDEQYLPGTLKIVTEFFNKHPEIDILFGSMLIVDDQGELLAFRKSMPMRLSFLRASYLYNFSCATFFRRELFDRVGGFDSSFKASGDMDFVYKALCSGAKTRNINRFLSTFIYNKNNLSSTDVATNEHNSMNNAIGIKSQPIKIIINIARLLDKLFNDGYRCQTPLNYAIYKDNSNRRKDFSCSKASSKWPGHNKPYLFKHKK
ncbi:MAG: glycosyltransferase family 2 protein [Kiritimatiellae bacterium]|jgi:glycosyltransferase involved in cell wall biosynthesis|nr:glycosyltransferase family 2 protein [Kiritimatiellia bacterium]